MAAAKTQISAVVSAETKARLEQYAQTFGVKKSHCIEMAEVVGCVGVVVDALPRAISFYERYGFEPLEVLAGRLPDRPAPQPMFVPPRRDRAALADSRQA